MKSEAAKVVKAATAVPTSYGTWDSGWIAMNSAKSARLLCSFVKSDATTLELKFEVEDKTSDGGYETFKVASGAAELDEIAITAAGLSATHRLALPVEFPAAWRFKLHAKTTGGGGAATLALDVVVGS